MKIQRATPVNELLAKLIFLIFPTTLICYFLLYHINGYYSILGNQEIQAMRQTLYLGGGMGIAALFYSFRFRFLPSFLLLVFILFTISKGLDHLSTGEFDGFFIPIRFFVFANLFAIGWLVGWGFVRWRYWSVLIAASLLASCIALIAKSNADSVLGLMKAFAPALLYSVYIIFTSEQIYNYKDKSQRFWWFLSRRLLFFGLLAVLLFSGVYYLMRDEIKETVANYGGGGKGGNSMLKQNKNGTFDLNDYSRLSSSLGRSNELLFCAHIDNFFPGTDIPNPLYLTAFYYTKFDTLTETFERDSTIPQNDLFEPNPASLPLFFTKTDSSVIRNSLNDNFRKTVDIEVYAKALSPTTYLAPNIGFFVQPIAVEKDFRNEFKTAFRAKSYVSELNSAYFVYNVPNPQIRKFQEQRFAVLRNVTGYDHVSPRFFRYYTYMPSDAKFKRIADLAQQVTKNAHTPVDKVIAIRDFFLSKDENGDPLFKYSDNPGIPDIPSASKLMYFLFENRKGYCAYYAGATLFMLRALGIPSRIAVGFLTEERSDKNKGWYWYYANQAHAWVQVYFPGYGWIDFDTTVGNSDTDARQTPAPDGTPPMQPPKAWLAADGIVENVDTLKKTIVMQVKHMVFHDKEYTIAPVMMDMDMKIATVLRDSIEVPLATVQKGDQATAVSYAQALKNMTVTPNERGNSIVKRIPRPTPTDEVYLKPKYTVKKEEKPRVAKQAHHTSVLTIVWTAAGIVFGLLLLFLLMPVIILQYYMLRHNSARPDGDKPYWAYLAATFYLHQIGYIRGDNTPMQYASKVVDPAFGTSFTGFMNIYLKKKYAKQPLNAQEQQQASTFLKPFIKKINTQIPFKKRFAGFINPIRTITYYNTPDAAD